MGHMQSQADIVKEFMFRQEEGQTITEPVRLPGMDQHFAEVPDGAEVKVDTVRIPGLQELAVKTRQEIAEALSWVIDYKPGVVGFEWTVGDPNLRISYVEGFRQNSFESEGDRAKLISLINLILKIRREIVAVKWSFGETFVEVTNVV